MSIQEDGCDKGAHQSYLGTERNTPVIPNWFQSCQCCCCLCYPGEYLGLGTLISYLGSVLFQSSNLSAFAQVASLSVSEILTPSFDTCLDHRTNADKFTSRLILLQTASLQDLFHGRSRHSTAESFKSGVMVLQ